MDDTTNHKPLIINWQMIEIRFHSRGGQGAKTAATFLADAFGRAGSFVQAFPDFGPEREGAPMKTYLRIDRNPVRVVEGIKEPTIIIIIDETLLDNPGVKEGMTNKTVTIVNSCDSNYKIKKEHKYKGKVLTLNAMEIAKRRIGKPIPNTVMLGALIRVLGDEKVTIDKFAKFIEKAFVKKLGEKLAKANAVAVKDGFKSVK